MKIEPIISSTAGWCEVRGSFVIHKIFLELHSKEKVLKRSPKQPKKKMETRLKCEKQARRPQTDVKICYVLLFFLAKILNAISNSICDLLKTRFLQFKGPLHSKTNVSGKPSDSKFILKDVMDTRSSWRGKLRVLHPQLNTLTSIQTTSSPRSLFSQESRLTVSSAEDEVSLMSPSPKETFGSHIRCRKTFTCRWWCRNTTTAKTPISPLFYFPRCVRLVSHIYSHAAHVTWTLKGTISRDSAEKRPQMKKCVRSRRRVDVRAGGGVSSDAAFDVKLVFRG